MNGKRQPSWLRNAILYEIYPSSFKDSNGDGIGDLQGVIEKLDYIRSLGCDVIWLNPCFESPFRDGGYDISDYRKVAARFGSDADLVRLFEEAHACGLRIVLDLVAGHTSDEHPWFRASAGPDGNAYSDYYVWTPTVWAASPPEYPFIRGASQRNGGYLSNFFSFQPALNYGFAEPEDKFPWQQPPTSPAAQAVKQELRSIMEYWLKLGCDGFRVDMAESLIKGNGEAKLSAMTHFWREIRQWFDEDWPEAVLISEWSKPQEAIGAGFHVDFLIHFGHPAYNSLFRAEGTLGVEVPGGKSFFSADGEGDITTFTGYYEKAFEQTKQLGYISIPTGNHDICPRLADGRTDAELRVALVFLFTMPGIPAIYQGDEIGMMYVPGLPSKEGGFERTGSRTPMQWDASSEAGFSDAAPERLYLPLDPRSNRPNVQDQENDPNSILNFVRSLVTLRKRFPALGSDGDYRGVHAVSGETVYAYERSLEDERYLVVLNPAGREASCEWQTNDDWRLVEVMGQNACVDGRTVRLGAAGYLVAKTTLLGGEELKPAPEASGLLLIQ